MEIKNSLIKTLLLLITAFAISCNNKPKERGELEYTIITIEDCEYINYKSAMGYYEITHKGNCKNSIHIHKK